MIGKKRLLLLLALVALGGAIAFAICVVYVEMHRMEKPPVYPYAWGKMTKVDGDYNMTVIEASSFGLNVEDVDVEISNASGCIIFREKLDRLVDNKRSSVVFYDRDNNNAISKGDVLNIKGRVFEQATRVVLCIEHMVVYSYNTRYNHPVIVLDVYSRNDSSNEIVWVVTEIFWLSGNCRMRDKWINADIFLKYENDTPTRCFLYRLFQTGVVHIGDKIEVSAHDGRAKLLIYFSGRLTSETQYEHY